MMHVLASQRNPIIMPVLADAVLPPTIDATLVDDTADDSPTHKWVQMSSQAFENNSRLLSEGHWTDLSLSYGGDVIPVHRAIICGRSPVFKAQCDGRFAESDSKIIQIGAPSATLGAIARMLLHLYTHDYPDRSDIVRSSTTKAVVLLKDEAALTNPPSTRILPLTNTADATHPAQEYFDPSSIPLRNLHVYGLADYYNIVDAKNAAKSKFTDSLEEVTESTELQEIIAQVYEYTNSTDPLRSIVTIHAAALR